MQIILRNFRANLTPTLLRLLAFTLLFGVVLAQVPTPNVLAAGEPKLILTKSIEGGVTTAQVGDVIRYRIRLECSSLVDPCGALSITDVLQSGLTYLPPPNSSVPAGFTITEAPTGTITITKDDNLLLDGSQYDAVIAVRVNYDLRPLPATINNTINGTIDPPGPIVVQNALPASAPPITISGLNPSWGLSKTLFSPSINPTVDTDVTYQIRLCPTGVSGNVPMQNIVITDTLPTGATFRSASDGGTNSSGIVTWPVVPGPITPPACVTRYVTILYPAGSFPIGPNVTNNVSATGNYLDSNGLICSPCVGITPDDITHPIDIIRAIPTYNKNDVGDPVGMSGTARFVLSLNTNGTNFPSNNVMLIDNMPPQLQVTEITGGAWSAAFDYVRAYIDYSTNNANSWTLLAGPYSYNAGGTYTAPFTNITNVRWRFEYDSDRALPFDAGTTLQGLPYTWSFTGNPQIRVKPRTVAVNTTAPVVSLPIAVNGTTYNNCVQVSRVDNLGNQLDPCANEDMTVRGDFVSLRTTKDETPGVSWDDLYDPLINTFTPDFNILPGDTLKYTITVDMTERSSAPMIDPTILDTLPADLVFVRNGTATLDGAAIAQPLFTQVGQNLKWTWDTLLGGPGLTVPTQPLGSHLLTVEFFARIPRGQTPGLRTNDLYVVTDSVDVLCEISGTQSTDTGSIDGDLNTTEAACKNTDGYIVERSAALRGEKWIRSIAAQNNVVINSTTFLPDASCPNGSSVGLPGGGSNNFTRFPCISQAYPENAFINGIFVPPPTDPTLDDFEYNLRIFNDGNVPMMRYVLYDILPYYGDKGSGGTLADSPRLTDFRPLLRGPIQFLSGPAGLSGADFTIEYNLTTNPCRPEVFNTTGTVPSGCDNTWTTTWSTAMRSYRIRLNTGSLIQPSATSVEVRFGVPMNIPAEAPPLLSFNSDDAQSKEIAWNSFSHVGSYTDLTSTVKDLLASEPRKVGITVPEVMSIGNRVWRDSDNSGTINAPDDTDPGIGGVAVNLYRDANNDGTPDGPAIATTITDTAYTDTFSVYHDGGYYLFSNIPYDSVTPGNNRYIVGIPASNFVAGQSLNTLRSSTGTPPDTKYTSAPLDGNVDMEDHGRDPAVLNQEVFSPTITLNPTTEQTSETDLSDNDRDGPAGTRRGVNGERDYNSDLTVDFGFFGGSDIPFSIGNHLWFDNGTGGGTINDGIRQAGELPIVGARVELYRDGNKDGIISPLELIRFDVTDSGGFYLFDNLDPGDYYVLVPNGNFTNSFDPDGAGTLYAPTTGVLQGWYSSVPTGTETTGVNGGITTADIDSDDNGINNDTPEVLGVVSSKIVLDRTVSEPLGETHLSSDSSMALGFNPTAGDGTGHIGRFLETDATSNMTIDFGFIPPMSLGNRVWFDSGSTAIGILPSQFNNGIMDGTEVGVSGVRVELYRDTNLNGTLEAGELLRFTTTDANGYYLFEGLQPGNNYYVHIPASNFVTGPLLNYISSFDATAPLDNAVDKNDNGIDNATPATTGITSQVIAMTYNTEPTTPPTLGATETDISADVATYGVGNVGLFVGQTDANSNLTIDFGFVRPPRSLGNRLWFDNGTGGGVVNDRILNGTEPPVVGARVSLYRDNDNNGQPDDLGVAGVFTDDWIAWDTTDVNGYYLFDNLPSERYIVGVDYTNFAGGVLTEYTSSTGNVDNASNNTDSRDNGVDRILPGSATASPYGVLSTTIDLTVTPLVGLPTGETVSGNTVTTFGNNPTAGDGTASIGRFGELDANSDLTIDFGFFKPMSLGNRVFRDDGGTIGTINNGIMDGDEQPFAGVRVELYRDTNGTAGLQIATDTLINFDITDAGGYYLFDRLTPGNYFAYIASGNFAASFDPDGGGPLPAVQGALRGWSNSTPTFATDVDVNDNGMNNAHPNINGIASGLVTLDWDTEPAGETELSSDASAPSANNNPTAWDGPNSRGRWNESDDNSNLTVDFGFIPPLSLGNRVWIDDGITATGNILSQFNNGVMDGTEVGRANVVLNLYFDANNDGDYADTVDGVSEAAIYRTTTTDANGYYLFDGLPLGRFYVQVAASNFNAGNALYRYLSSTGSFATENVDVNDNGIDATNSSMNFILSYGGEPLTPAVETDIPAVTVPNQTAYGNNLRGRFGETDSSSNLTLDFGFMSPHSIGNRVWRDSDNSGTINGPDDVNPGIAGVTVNLYSGVDANTDNIPDGPVIAATTTDSFGFYLFDNLPTGNYIVGIPASNFATSTDPLYALRSSTGTPASATYQNPPETNADINDHGIDSAAVPPTPSTAVYSHIIPLAENEVTGETDLPANTPANQTAYGTNLRGRYGEPDISSDLTVDFGFFGGSDVPFSIGNQLWYDNGAGTNLNNGIRDIGELPVVGVVIYLYRDGNGNNIPDAGERMPNRSDITDAGGFYLFDNLDPGTYFVQVAASNFDTIGDPLAGWFSSQPTGSETVGVNLGTTTADIDNDDNGVNTDSPETGGVFSGAIILTRDPLFPEPSGENPLSGDTSIALGFDPTAGDGPFSRGRFGETDITSNLTIDFGFIPPMSLGNRVWIDNGAGEATFRAGYNNAVQDGTEVGVNGVRVELWRDTNGTADLQILSDTFVRAVTTDAQGYYLFDYLQPGANYYIHIPDDNFGNATSADLVPGNPLLNYISSYDRTPPADDTTDKNDNGRDNAVPLNAAPLATGITSQVIVMAYNTEPTTLAPVNETDIPPSTPANIAAYGANLRGRFNQADSDSNLTMDFGFIRAPHSVGNRLWFDVNNNRQVDAGELPVVGARVSLYRDTANNGMPDDVNLDTLFNGNDAIAYDVTDAGGFYLFDNLPPDRYIVGVDSINFQAGNVLVEYASSTGTTVGTDNRDNGIDRIAPANLVDSPHGILSGNINLLGASPAGELSLSSDTGSLTGFNPTEDDGPLARGRYGEVDTNSNLLIDFGFYKFMSLGNRVFRDNGAGANLNNGIMDVGELPFAGVRVELYRDTNNNGVLNIGAGDTFLNFDNTDANGYYLFDGLTPANNYFVHIPVNNFTGAGVLRGWSNSTPTFATDVDRDDNGVNNAYPDLNNNGITSGLIVLAWDTEPTGEELSGDSSAHSATNSPTAWDGPTSSGRWNESDDNSNLTVDFGFIPPLSLGNRVWIDDGSTAGGLVLSQFNDGIMNGTELGRSGVVLNLYYSSNDADFIDTVNGVSEAAIYRTTTTDANGYYIFDGLPLGQFYVQVAASNFAAGNALENLVSSTGSFATENVDVNDNGIDATNSSMNFVLGYGTLPLAETVSGNAAHGPAGWGNFGELDANSNLTLDFGFLSPPRSLGNRIWLDDGTGVGGIANNGIMDGTEVGINGVTVSLYDDNDGDGVPNGVAIATATTGTASAATTDDGYYLFSNLPAGRYIVGVDSGNFATVLLDMISSVDAAGHPVDGDVDKYDHGIDQVTPATSGILSPTIDLRNPPSEPTGETDLSGIPADGPNSRGTHNETDNQSDLTVDFGFYYPYSLGNRVWYDTNNNSAMDAGETGIQNVRVELYRDTNANGVYDAGTDAALGFANTDVDGYYRFDRLTAGEYLVVIPADNFTTGATTDVLIGYWSSGTSINASGVTSDSTSLVANDPDNNIDSDENGVTTFTGSAINYVSSAAVTLGANAEPPTDNDPLPNPAVTDEAANNRSNRTLDFGFYQVGIGDLIFLDADKNGANGAGDTPLNGATVQVFASNTTGTTTTELQVGTDGIWNTADDNSTSLITTPTGLYAITGLPAGNYIVKVTPPVGYVSTIDSNPQNDNDDPDYNVNDNDNGQDENSGLVSSDVLTMTPGGGTATGGGAKTVTILAGTTTDNSVDFGFVAPLYSLGNRVWLDTDNDGVIDASESGLIGVRVELYRDTNTNGVYDAGIDTFVGFADTDADGYYRFDGLVAGEYVVLIPADNFRNLGLGDNVAGDPLAAYWSTGTSVNSAGVLSESVTNDPDNDRDSSSLALSDENGETTFTSTSLASANPINYVSSAAVTLGPDTAEPTGETNLSTTGQGTNDNRANMTVDFGFYSVGIGNLIFVDAEVFDGAYNSATDTLLAGATVDLYASDSTTLIRSVTTIADGIYSFAGLPAGDYIVKVTPPIGYASTVDTNDAADTTEPDNNKDNNDNGPTTSIGQVTSGILTMTPGGGTKPDTTPKTVTILDGTTTDNSVDFGFTTLTFSLGNRVWYDTNNDGILDTNENGISGVRVEVFEDTGTTVGVYDAGDAYVNFANTDPTGYYRFDHLPAGNYVVVIPSNQFIAAAPLEGYWSSGTTRADDGTVSESATNDPDTNADSNVDENGVTTFASNAINYVSSAAVTLGPPTNEPALEADLSASGQGTIDNRANMTVDFGFYTVEIGDLIFVDMNANGSYLASDDLKLSGATVELFAGDGTTSLGSVITGINGTYAFAGLPEGNYIVKVTPPDGFVSTRDLGTTPNPDNNTDNDDNGITESVPGQVTSGTLVMTAGEKGDNATGTTSDPTVDFGFKAAYSLGNRVWFDTNNDSQFNSILEVGIENVFVELYNADASGNPIGAAIRTDTTDANGYYRFDNLPPANYVVVIPADNFINNGANDVLVGYWSSGTTMDSVGINHETAAPGPEVSSSDIDDNGELQPSGAVISAVVTLGNQAEPTADSDPSTNPLTGESPNDQSNRTVDFGFYRVEVSNQVFVDLNENGTFDVATDLVLPYTTVKLFASDGTTELDSVTTDAAGTYLFTGLPEGDYIVKVTPPNGYSSTNDTADTADTSDPNVNTDNNDNGIGTGTGEVSSNDINLAPSSSGDNSTGTTSYPTLDFGFTVSLAKTVIGTDAAHTTVLDAAIGEIITYEITLLIPVGTLTNATVVDTPQTGLAFVDCIDINLPAGVTSTNITDGACSAKDGITVGTSNPLIENDGGRATFDFGNITNAGVTPQIATIRYSLIVLDINTNHSGDIRTNSVVWSSDGGTKTVNAAPVKIVEPQISIDKRATPTTAEYGTAITFTIDIAHDLPESTADAFDVVVTDQIPAGLVLNPASVNVSGTATPSGVPPYSYDVATNTLTVRWDIFRLGQTGRITFQATFVGPAPVTNSASVEWTSLLIDPSLPPTPDPLSPYNVDSTERWYDPGTPASVNNYQVLDSVTLSLPNNISASMLPATGFAPNVITQLPAMPKGFSYTQTDFWVEIPSLNLKMDIVGVPFNTDTNEWNLSWLADNAGWLENTAYPTHAGNSAITAHTTLASGLPGPFAKLDSLSYSDQIIIHLKGQKYIYEVRENKQVRPNAVNSVLKHEEYSWLTLITCKSYNEKTGDYTYRTVVRAVLVKLADE